jgi:hypothetical protein
MRFVAIIIALCIAGCQTTLDPNFSVQMEAYRLTITSQQSVEVARARAEEARYNAMALIAERSDANTKSMALFALAMSGRGGDASTKPVEVHLPRIPETAEDRALKWATVFAGPTTALVSSYFGYQLGKVQSNNQAQTTQASYAALVAFKPAPQPIIPTTVNNITNTANTDLWNRDGFVLVGAPGQGGATTGSQDNSPVVVVPPAPIVPVVVTNP